MKVWQKDKNINFGKTLLAWRHRSVSRFIMKKGSWLLGAFVFGLLTSIFFHTIQQDSLAQNMGRIAFAVVLITGILSAFFRHIYYGLYYRITEKALVAIRPFCGFERLMAWVGSPDKAPLSKLEYLPWEDIKEVKDEKGSLLLVLKDQDEPLQIGVAPVRALLLPLADGEGEQRTNRGGIFGKDNHLDKETIRLVVQKIREVKKSGTGKKSD